MRMISEKQFAELQKKGKVVNIHQLKIPKKPVPPVDPVEYKKEMARINKAINWIVDFSKTHKDAEKVKADIVSALDARIKELNKKIDQADTTQRPDEIDIKRDSAGVFIEAQVKCGSETIKYKPERNGKGLIDKLKMEE